MRSIWRIPVMVVWMSVATSVLFTLLVAVMCLAIGAVPVAAAEGIPPEHAGASHRTGDEYTGELLYNGIRLPQAWPPDRLSPDSKEPMPVPYLDQPPEVIPIDVGRQLFVDDFLIEESTLKRTYHKAVKYAGNPVFKAETEWELKKGGSKDNNPGVYLHNGGVFFDPGDKLFRMYYNASYHGHLALATTADFLEWDRPEVVPGRGNTLTPNKRLNNSVWLDLNPPNPKERLKVILETRTWASWSLYTAANERGFSDLYESGLPAPQASSPGGDYASFFFNPFRRVWVFSIKGNNKGRGRCRYYHEHPVFLQGNDWQRRQVFWTGADRLDMPEPEGRYPGAGEPPQLYGLNAVAYESLMVGVHYIHRGPNNGICGRMKIPKLTDLELGFSRDGFHWHRPSRDGFISGARVEGSWDRAHLSSPTGCFVTFGDRLIFPYTGSAGVGPDGKPGTYTGGAIGLAILRRDGFASMNAGPEAGTLTTRRVTFNGKHLFVNAKAPQGRLRAAVLDEQGKPIAPFTLADSVPFAGDSTLQMMTWKEGSDLSALNGKPVRFRFDLTDGSLYSFWVSRDDAGRSDGYVGAGGPGYDGVVDTVGRAALQHRWKGLDRREEAPE